jgi:hypothetical protein
MEGWHTRWVEQNARRGHVGPLQPLRACAPTRVSRQLPRSMHVPAPTSTCSPSTTRSSCGFLRTPTSPSTVKPKPSAPMRTPLCTTQCAPTRQCSTDACAPSTLPSPSMLPMPSTLPGWSSQRAPTYAPAETTAPGATIALGCTCALSWIKGAAAFAARLRCTAGSRRRIRPAVPQPLPLPAPAHPPQRQQAPPGPHTPPSLLPSVAQIAAFQKVKGMAPP